MERILLGVATNEAKWVRKFFQDDLNGAKGWLEAQTIRKDVHNIFKGAIQIPSNMG
jgi:hypothetical protein